MSPGESIDQWLWCGLWRGHAVSRTYTYSHPYSYWHRADTRQRALHNHRLINQPPWEATERTSHTSGKLLSSPRTPHIGVACLISTVTCVYHRRLPVYVINEVTGVRQEKSYEEMRRYDKNCTIRGPALRPLTRYARSITTLSALIHYILINIWTVERCI